MVFLNVKINLCLMEFEVCFLVLMFFGLVIGYNGLCLNKVVIIIKNWLNIREFFL